MGYYTDLLNDVLAETEDSYRSFLPTHLFQLKQEANAAALEIYQAIDKLEQAADAARRAGNETEAEDLTLKAVVLACELTGKIPQRNTKARALSRKFEAACLLHLFRDRQIKRINSRLSGSVSIPSLAVQIRGIRAGRARKKSSTLSGRSLSGPDEPDPDPDPDRPYIALGIDHKATTPAGPPVPVSLRLFSLYRIEMRYCHEGDQPDHPEP
ncbi:hypothetical protein ABIE61_001802 [Marinobacterium sp. MBR-111]|jgi:hypothetical protein|uniref:hypothetical protein n=1 Tax=Marinobacterium sp. MBR-111 TaxID=3156463 RepID=UPI0033966AB3